MKLDPTWIAYWRERLRIMVDKSIVAMPLRGLAYSIDKTTMTATLFAAARPTFEKNTDRINRACLEALDYKIVVAPDAVIDDPEVFVQRITQRITPKEGIILFDHSVLDAASRLFGV